MTKAHEVIDADRLGGLVYFMLHVCRTGTKQPNHGLEWGTVFLKTRKLSDSYQRVVGQMKDVA
ncbi:MAG: hypothetical protein VX589_01340 [Myxococcota bacterium]|nr:hypothetical protein [Myxococcota bacterium]